MHTAILSIWGRIEIDKDSRHNESIFKSRKKEITLQLKCCFLPPTSLLASASQPNFPNTWSWINYSGALIWTFKLVFCSYTLVHSEHTFVFCIPCFKFERLRTSHNISVASGGAEGSDVNFNVAPRPSIVGGFLGFAILHFGFHNDFKFCSVSWCEEQQRGIRSMSSWIWWLLCFAS